MDFVWAAEILKSIVFLISEALIQEWISDNVFARFQSQKVNRNVSMVVEKTLAETLADFPGFQSELDGSAFLHYLKQPRVSHEFAKIINPWKKPDVSVLSEEWQSFAGSPLQGSAKLFIEMFLSRLNWNLQEIKELHETLHIRESREAHDQMYDLLQQIAVRVSSPITITVQDDSKKELTPDEQRYDAKLDTCRELLKCGRPRAALALLLKIEKDFLGKQASNYLGFRLHTLIGGCKLELDDEKEAIERFNLALRLAPENPKAIANASLAALLEDRIEDAAELANQAIRLGGDDTAAPAVLINALAKLQNYEHLDELVNEDFFNNIDYTRALGNLYSQVKDFQNAEKYYRLCLAKNTNDFQSNLNLAQIIVDTRLNPAHRFLHPYTERNPDWEKSLAEAINLIDHALSIAQQGDNEARVHQALTARSALHFVQGDLKRAKEDGEKVLKDSPAHIGSLHNLGIFASLEEDFILAVELFNRLPEDYRVKESVIFAIARAYIEVGQPEETLNLLNRYVKAGGKENDHRVAVFTAAALIKQEKVDEANQVKEKLLQLHPVDVDILLAASFIENLLNNNDRCIQLLLEAYRLAEGNSVQQEEIALRLATTYYFVRDFTNAVEWFDKLGQWFLEDRSLARACVQSLYSIGRYNDAYTKASKARMLGIVDPTLVDIEAWLAEYSGDLRTALALEYLLTEIDPNNISHKLHCARLEYRLENIDNAKGILQSLPVDQIKNPIDLMQVAELHYFLGDPQTAIEYAYRARTLGIDSPEIHLAYAFLFLRVEDVLDSLHSQAVGPDTAVLLAGHDKKWIKIFSRFPADEGNWEFSSDSTQADILVDHTVGESVVFKKGPIESLEFQIAEIQSIYVRAYQESFDEFGTRFPDHPGIHKLQIVNQDYTKFFTLIYQHSAFAETVYNVYASGAISVEQFANFIGQNIIDVFSSLLGLKDQRIYADYGNAEGQSKQATIIQSATSISLDLTGLLSFASLDFLAALPTRFNHIYVSQRLIDEIERTIAEKYLELKKGRHTIGFHEGRPFFEEYSPRVIENNIEYLRRLIRFCRDHCEVIPIPLNLAGYLILPEDRMKNIGHVSICSILVAQHTTAPLFADDARLRKYAEQNHQVLGFWTQPVLLDMANKGVINHNAYINACVRLLEANYFFTPINENIILDALKLSHYTSDYRVRAVLRGLHGPEATEETIIPIVAQLLRNIWLSAIPNDQRLLILDQVLPALCHGRNRPSVLTKLVKLIKLILATTPDQQNNLIREIVRWNRVMGEFGR